MQLSQPDSDNGSSNCLFVLNSAPGPRVFCGLTPPNSLVTFTSTACSALLNNSSEGLSSPNDNGTFVSGCSFHSCSKSSSQPLMGSLHPLFIPTYSSSHINVDFVTGLPLNGGQHPYINHGRLLSLFLSYHLPLRLQTSWCTMCSDSTAFPGTLCYDNQLRF